jgi:hypothetical protein
MRVPGVVRIRHKTLSYSVSSWYVLSVLGWGIL